jgi:riboflavin kinase/FMN adenylyltransferase
MLVVHGYQQVPNEARGAALAVGNFDGVHRGHQALLERALVEGRKRGRPAGAIVFEPHPREFFLPREPHFRLTPIEEKLEIFAGLGLDVAVIIPFDAALAKLEADDFIARVLVGALAISHIVIGYDFFFGRNRTGTPETMRAAGEKFGFGVTIVEPVAEAGEPFSSSAIRVKLAQGDVTGAAHDLGRPWRATGRIIAGAQRGQGLGFPTANIPLARGTALAHGIYAVRAYLEGKRLDGAAYLGTRPTFDNGRPVLEVFLFDFAGELYGREVTVEFIAHIRDDRRFDSAEALIAQMHADCEQARAILAASAPFASRGPGC